MAIIIRKKSSEIHPEAAVNFKNKLPSNDKIGDVRFVKSEHLFYIFNGYSWQELDLVIE